MKLINLKVKGITSLREAQNIEFEKMSLSEGLFAITGPTGSGKSSLLTAIFLALYGQAPKNLNREDVITIGEKEGKTELTFELRGRIYTAKWSCRVLSKKGEPLANPVTSNELYSEGKRLETTPEELLKLDMDQFSKTIIINQGQFADFLTSKFKERRKILENLCHAEILGEIAPQLRKEKRQLEHQIQVLEGKIEGGLPFDQETYLSYCDEIKRCQSFAENLKEYLPPRKEYLRIHTEALKLIKETLKQKKELAEIEKMAKKTYHDYQKQWEETEKLNRHKDQISPLIKDIKKQLSDLVKKHTHYTNHLKNLNFFTKKNQELEGRLKDQKKQYEGQKTKSTQLEKERNDLKESLRSKLVYIDIENMTREPFQHLSDKAQSLELLTEQLHNGQKEQEENNKRLQHLADKASTLKSEVEKRIHLFKGGESFEMELFPNDLKWEELEKNQNLFSEAKRQIEQEITKVEETIESTQKAKHQDAEIKHQIHEFASQVESLNAEIHTDQKQLESFQEMKQNLISEKEKCEAFLEKKQIQQEVHHLRHLGNEQGQCPVCHSPMTKEDHGDHEETNSHEIEETQKRFQDIQAKLEDAQTKSYHFSESLKQKHSQKKELQEQIQNKKNLQKEIRENVTSKSPGDEKSADSFETILRETQKNKNNFHEVKNHVHHLEQLVQTEKKRLEELRKEYQNLKKAIASLQQNLKERGEQIEQISREICSSKALKSSINKVNVNDFLNEWKSVKSQIYRYLEMRENLASLSQNLKTLEEAKQTTSKDLQENLKEKEVVSNESNELKDEIHSSWKKLHHHYDSVLNQISYFSKSDVFQNLAKISESLTLENAQQHFTQLEKNLEELEVFFQRTEEEQRQLLQERLQKSNYYSQQKDLKGQTITEKEDLSSTLLHKAQLQQKHFQSCFWAPTRLSPNIPRFQELNHGLDEGLGKIESISPKTFLKDLTENTNDSQQDGLSIYQHFIEEVLELYVDTLELTKSDIEKRIIELQTNIETYERKGKEQEVWQKELRDLKSQKEKKDTLFEILGGDEFSRFAMSFIEDQIMAQANWELKNLCEGRYEIITRTRNKSTGPKFFVKDIWKNASIRPIESLSGGETFLVSLAMALGLAELSRGQTDIETLIIDEGFGTLDEDAIDDVLNVLHSIQARGKQIGVISHVKSLTERIPVNIHLEKNHFGESKVDLRYLH